MFRAAATSSLPRTLINKTASASTFRLYPYRTVPERSQEIANLLGTFASHKPTKRTDLATLLSFGRPLTPESLLASLSFTLAEIPRRLATRIRLLESLPYIIVSNPYISGTLNGYKESFRWLATYPEPTSLDENTEFVHQLETLVRNHTNDIPAIAKGFQECSRYMSPIQISEFLDSVIRSRVSVRLIAEQHIALSQSLLEPDKVASSHVGVVNMRTSPKDMINMCASFVSELCEGSLGAAPKVVIDGHPSATFAYVPVHLEYILTEVLKNAFRATVEHHIKLGISRPLPPVVVTVSPPPMHPGGDPSTNFFSIRVRDSGGGVSPANMANIFSYAYTTAGRGAANDDDPDYDGGGGGGPYAAQHVGGSASVDGESGHGNMFGEITSRGVQTGLGTIAGLGYGLPMSRLYAKYFGGSLDLYSLEGWGSDVFIKLRCLEEVGHTEI